MSLDLRTVLVDGRRVRYADAGDQRSDRVLVLLHAFPAGVGMWEPQLEAFPGWRVVAPALPGFDGSAPPGDASMDGYARHVLGLLDHLGVERGVFGGLSMGGYVAFGVVRQAAARVDGLMLADTRGGADTGEGRAARLAMLELLEREGPARIARDLLPKLLGRTTLKQRGELVQHVRRLIEVQTKEAIGAATRAMMERPDAGALLDGIRAPTLVIVGEEDTLTPPAEAERMHAAIPAATLVRIPGAGHLSNLENPGAFNDAVAGWLPNCV